MKTTLKILIEKINESINYVENEQTFNTEREKLLTSQAYKNIICMIDDFKLLDKERNMIIDSYADGKISVVTGDNIPYHEYFNKKWVSDINSNKWSNNDNTAGDNYDSSTTGTKCQQERSYSEEDLREAFIAGGNSQIEEDDDHGTKYSVYMEEWFEQFRKIKTK